jgi:hypothetical protein
MISLKMMKKMNPLKMMKMMKNVINYVVEDKGNSEDEEEVPNEKFEMKIDDV